MFTKPESVIRIMKVISFLKGEHAITAEYLASQEIDSDA